MGLLRAIDIAAVFDEPLNLSRMDLPGAATGLFFVPPDVPASSLAEIMDEGGLNVAFIAELSDRAVGVVLPEAIIDEFNERYKLTARRFGDVVTHLNELIGSLAGAKKSLKWLSEIRRPLYWCSCCSAARSHASCKKHNSTCAPLAD